MPKPLALVTGATSGIGLALCALLAKKGYDLIATGRNEQQLQQLKEQLQSQVEVQSVTADLATDAGSQTLISIIHTHCPDLVINNAGFGLYGEALTHSTEQQAQILKVNGQAVLELTLESARTWRSLDRQGIIVNVSSVAGFQMLPLMAVYAASKAFVNHFSEALDFEMAPYGIRILAACPGKVATNFQARAGGEINSKEKGIMTSAFVAEQIWIQIEQRQHIKIIDWRYRLLHVFSFLVPKSWVAKASQRVIGQRLPPRTFIPLKK